MPIAVKSKTRISSSDFITQPLNGRLQQNLPKQIGEGKTEVFMLEHGLNLIETHLTPVNDLAIFSNTEQQSPRLVLTLAFKGQSCFESKLGETCCFKQGYATVTRFNSMVGNRLYKAEKETLQLRLVITDAWLKKYFDKKALTFLDKPNRLSVLSHRPITTQAMLAAQQLMSAKSTKTVDKLSRHGLALQVLATELNFLEEGVKAERSGQHSRVGLDSLEKAREILETEFKSPPSVAQLARQSGTNTFKLKQLFHQYLGTTPYAYLHGVRMKKAYQMLESRQYYVSTVAYAVGYNHAGNFSSAFTKYFGFPPKFIVKK